MIRVSDIVNYYQGKGHQNQALLMLDELTKDSPLFADDQKWVQIWRSPDDINIHPQIMAFLKSVRVHEGTSANDGYNIMFTGKKFHSFADHPRQLQSTNGLTSDAAGAYQFLSTTWDDVARQISATSFSPHWQDLAAAKLIKNRGAHEDIISGDMASACDKCSWEWASMPDRNGKGRYGQPNCSFKEFVDIFVSYGGKLA
jgi:muramidase (phage lysozyme)